jgi:3-oxoacyl-[acyl-carrier protein] reductase
MNRALITGASRGIGKEIADLFQLNGVEVISPTRDELDLSNRESLLKFCERFDWQIDILINNAGINPIRKLDEFDFDTIQEVYMVNVFAPLMLMQYASKYMKLNNCGKIVNISSIWSNVSKAGRILYSGSKSAINAMTRTAAIELGENNILVNAIAPGFVDTELTRLNNTSKEIELILNNIPLNRLASATNVADLALFLCSDKNQYITGQTILIDGGFTCK